LTTTTTTATVETASGVVRGTVEHGVRRYLGIPYAVGERFRPPRPIEPWAGERLALAFGPIAPQQPGAQFISPDHPQNEHDCRTLNVWAPEGRRPGGRPVFVWVHGGAFRAGGTPSPLYDGAGLAMAGDLVVVTLNYRLGPLGFLAHPALAPDGDGPFANWGLLDQVEALRWVAANIEAFGGDPANVMLVGESAGASSVLLLAASPMSRGLVAKVIAQSPAALGVPLDEGIELAEALGSAAGASVGELADLPLDRLQLAHAQVTGERFARLFAPVVDGDVVARPGLDALRDGAGAGLSMIVGTNVDEWKLWAPADPRSRDLDVDGLRARLQRSFDDPDGVIAAVSDARRARGEPVAPNELWFAIETEQFFRAPTIAAAEAQLTHGPGTFVYLFDWCSPAMDGWLGACHGLEIPFVFGTHGMTSGPGVAAFTGSGPPADHLSAQMLGAWSAFARHGDPSTAELPWPRYDTRRRGTMRFGPESGATDAPRDEERALFASLGSRADRRGDQS